MVLRNSNPAGKKRSHPYAYLNALYFRYTGNDACSYFIPEQIRRSCAIAIIPDQKHFDELLKIRELWFLRCFKIAAVVFCFDEFRGSHSHVHSWTI